MKKKKIIVFIVLSLITMFYTMSAEQNIVDSNYMNLITNITNSRYGNTDYIGVQLDGNLEKYDDNTIKYEDNSYSYYIEKDRGDIKTILPKQESKTPLFDTINSNNDAEAAALSIVFKASPDILVGGYDIFSRKIGEDPNCFYSVEIWQKTENRVYTGRKANVQITEDGRLELYVAINNDFTKTPENITIDEQKAINLAYVDCKSKSQKFEEEANSTSNSEIEAFKIFIEDTLNHKVNSYLTYKNNNSIWVIEISDVKTNAIWGNMAFQIEIDAITGEVLQNSSTR